jgi:uncharacterized repeat protein (TIGR01451 family)
VFQRYLNRAVNPGSNGVPGSITLTNSSSATVSVPTGATVIKAELSWLGSTQLAGNNPPPGFPGQSIITGWDPNIWQEPMKVSVGDDTHFVSVEPDQGTSVTANVTPGDTNDYYYSASADITPLVSGRTGQITLWGADAAFPAPFFNMAGLGWNITVVYEYTAGVNLTANPPHVAKQITIQDGFVYQNAGGAPTNTVVNVPAVTDPNRIEVGLIAGEGDAGITGDRFLVNNVNITHPFTGATTNFFVSYAQGATDPNWTSNFSTDNVEWTLAPGIVQPGATSVTLTTTTSGDGFFLTGLNTAIPVPAVCLEKSVDKNPYTDVGETLTYTLRVTNCSGAPIDNVTVSDPLFVTPPLPSDCQHPAVLEPAASYTCNPTHIVTVGDIAAGQIVNTATANAFVPGTSIRVAPAMATATTKTSTSLRITKTGAPNPVHVGDPFTYTITVTNVRSADAANLTVRDPLPAGFVPSTPPPPNPTATSGATASIAGGVLTATLAVLTHRAPNSFTVTVTGTIASTFTGTEITNTATVEAPNTNCPSSSQDPNCKDTDTTVVLQPAPITIVKLVSTNTPRPGQTFTYTVQVRNTSSTTTATATVNDTFPPELVNASWTCAASTGSTCSETGPVTGNITDVALTLAPLGVATFIITVTVDPTFQGGQIVNTAIASPGDHTVCEDGEPECVAEVPVTSTPEPAPLQIEKSHTPTSPSPIPGEAITYTVTVTNLSPSTIAHATFDDPVPAGIDATGATWTTATTGTGTTVTPSSGTGFPTGETITLTIAPGGTVTFTINAHVSASFVSGDITNVATATPGTNTECADGEPECVAEDSFSLARLDVIKVRTPAVPRPGGQVVWRVIVSNPSSVVGVGTFSDPLPPQLDVPAATWTCTPGTGSGCGPPTTGTGSPTDVPITVARGSTVTFVITATILRTEGPVTVTNIGRVTPGTNTLCVDGQPTCDGEDSFTATPTPATLSIAKTHEPPAPTQGQAVTYTITVTNTSNPSSAQATVARATIGDPFDAPALTGITWTATATSGSTVTPTSGSAPINAGVVIVDGGSVTFTVHATVRPDWPGGDVINTSVITPDENGNTECDPNDDPSCSATTTFPIPSLITIVKTHEPTDPLPQPGQNVIYFVTITNLSDTQEAHATFNDPLPAELNRAAAVWSTTTTGTGTTVAPASGTGPPASVALTLGPEGTVTFVITAPILASFPGGTITNISTATPGDLTACKNGDPTCDASTSFPFDPPPASLAILKSVSPSGPLAPGDSLTYTITVTNSSTTTTGHGTVTDAVPPGLTPGGSWTATATPGSTVTPTSGSGTIAAQVTVAPGGHVTFTRVGQVDPTFTSDLDIDNIATLTPGPNTHCDPTNPTQACNSNAVVHVNVPAAPMAPPSPITPPLLPVTG